jgi:protein-disulfide isomerase
MENFNLPVPVNEHDHMRGPADALVTVVVYGDYECHDCRRMNRALLKEARAIASRIRYVYRHFPLVGVHPQALRAAEAAEAAGVQGRFWEMHELLFLNPDRLSDRDLRHYAQQAQLDMARFDREMAEGEHRRRIMEGRDQSIQRGITGAPTFYFNDVLFAGSPVQLLEQVKAVIEGKSRG